MTAPGLVEGREVNVMRDSGSTACIIAKRLVASDRYTGRSFAIILMDGTERHVPEALVYCETPFLTGKVRAAVVENPIFDFIVGNVQGVIDHSERLVCRATQTEPTMRESKARSEKPVLRKEDLQVNAAVTRSMAKRPPRPPRPLRVVEVEDLLQSGDVAEEQKRDPSLKNLWQYAETQRQFGQGAKVHRFTVENGRLYREISSDGDDKKQFVVPSKYRSSVFKLGHEAAMAGHMGRKKTLDRIQAYFFWPSMGAEIDRSCRSCDICQRTSDRGRLRPAPLQPLPTISEPFSRVAVDIVGPIRPPAKDGSRFILTLVDFATRWPEAVALKNIETVTVAEALLQMFSRLGIPQEILSDNGSQFTSEMMTETHRLMSIRPLFTTPYHPQGNGLCEKMNGTLKKMLRRMTAEQPRDWPRYLAPLLFAYREAPQASLKLSPFELMYGRAVRGPLTVLRDLWDGSNPSPEVKSSYQYVIDLEERLKATCQIAKEELLKAQALDRRYYNAKAKARTFQLGDKCLILLPTSTNKLLAQWSGPYNVVEVCSPLTYKVDADGVIKKLHINMLKPYMEAPRPGASAVAYPETARSKEQEELLSLVRGHYSSGDSGAFTCAAVITENDEEGRPITLTTLRSETSQDATVNPELSWKQRKQLMELTARYDDTFSDVPGRADVDPYTIKVLDNTPIRTRPYPIPFKLHSKVMKELQEMEAAGFIEPSTSSYCSPMVVVEKGDKVRICGDYRKLNSVVEFEAEPMANQEAIFSRLAHSKFFSKLDLTKGFFQIPLDPSSRAYTAFATPLGLKQYRVVPFGLTTSPAVFNRVMREVLNGIQGVEVFVDDILIHSSTWQTHLETISLVLSKLRGRGLTVKPSKCEFGQCSVAFLGHVIGNGSKTCQEDKVVKIRNAQPPTTKKQVRAFLGLCGYYRDFIPQFAETASPLFDLIKKNSPTKVQWDSQHHIAFESLKEKLCSEPILRLPDVSRPYFLRTDASNEGVGSVLLQEYEDGVWPVAYYSRRLKPAEKNYATVEKELLAVISGIKRFYTHLYGGEFTLETDHLPLQYLQASKGSNARLMRWALYLQQYRYKIRYIKGSLNVGADYLSRSSDH